MAVPDMAPRSQEGRPPREPGARPRFLEIRAKPGSHREGIRVLPGRIVEVRVRERAVEGRANEAILERMAKALGIPQSRIHLAGGARGRHKRILLEGMDPETALRLLQAGIPAGTGPTRSSEDRNPAPRGEEPPGNRGRTGRKPT